MLQDLYNVGNGGGGRRGLTDKSVDLYTAPRVEDLNPLADFLLNKECIKTEECNREGDV